MKNLFFGFIATILFSSVSFANNEIKKNEEFNLEKKNIDENFDAVSRLISESVNVWSKTPYLTFFNPEIVTLVEKKVMTKTETARFKMLYDEGYAKMLSISSLMSEANAKVISLKLSATDYKKYVDMYFAQNPRNSGTASKIIPNSKACAVSTALVALCDSGFFTAYCGGYVGYWIHC
jgi:ABC-type uncharacterized transport system substrate-binding protein